MHWLKAIVNVSSHCLPGKVEDIIFESFIAADRHTIDDYTESSMDISMHGQSHTTHSHQNESYMLQVLCYKSSNTHDTARLQRADHSAV